jgi:putative FmdB family regulatory protein
VLTVQPSGGFVPTYSYACTDCDDRFDAVQAFSDDALATCAKCSGRLRKLFNSVGVVFKGSGFYRTDNRESTKKSQAAQPDSSGSGGGEKAADGGGKSGKSSSPSDQSSGSKPAAAAASTA